MAQLFEQGKDFDQDLLGITVLHSLLQLAQRLEDASLSETLEDMRSMLSLDFHQRHSTMCNVLHFGTHRIDLSLCRSSHSHCSWWPLKPPKA